MQIGSEEWIAAVIKGASQLGNTVTTDQARQMALHAQLLIEWNRRVNLTAITDPMGVAVKHCLDAVAPLHLLPAEGALLDIGTGGGFPGIPLKILRPDLAMTLVDSVRKKISFVNHVIRQLKLLQIEALHVRAQSLALQESRKGRYTVIVFRAFSDLKSALQLALPLLAPQGRVIAYQGPNDPSVDKLTESDIGQRFQRVEQISYRLPYLGDERKLAVLQKI